MARHRVQVLRAGGKTLRRIAPETGIPLRSVKRIVRERRIEEPGDVATALERGVGRTSVVEAYRDRIAAVIAAEPKLPTVEVLHCVPAGAGGPNCCGGCSRSRSRCARAAAG